MCLCKTCAHLTQIVGMVTHSSGENGHFLSYRRNNRRFYHKNLLNEPVKLILKNIFLLTNFILSLHTFVQQ